jgi:hypothetical protein
LWYNCIALIEDAKDPEDRSNGRKSHDIQTFKSKDPDSLLQTNDLQKIFKIQEEAIDYKQTTQRTIMHKMLKQK